MKHLILDFGNTNIKAYVYNGDTLIDNGAVEGDFIKQMALWFKKYEDITHTAIVSVVTISPSWQDFLRTHSKLLEINIDILLPFDICYETPNSLGIDRIALIAAAVYRYPKYPVLVIDIGTCITYDIVTADRAYLGGNISPGLDMRLKSLHQFTDNLPLVQFTADYPLVGDSTENAIRAGVCRGIIAEIDSFVEQCHNQYNNLKVILTGGGASFFVKQLKSSIFAEPNFLSFGANVLLGLNKNKY